MLIYQGFEFCFNAFISIMLNEIHGWITSKGWTLHP